MGPPNKKDNTSETGNNRKLEPTNNNNSLEQYVALILSTFLLQFTWQIVPYSYGKIAYVLCVLVLYGTIILYLLRKNNDNNKRARVKICYTIRNPKCVVLKGTFYHSGERKSCIVNRGDDDLETIRNNPHPYFKKRLSYEDELYPIRVGSITVKLLEKSHTLDIETDHQQTLKTTFIEDGLKELGKHIVIDDQLEYIIDQVEIVR